MAECKTESLSSQLLLEWFYSLPFMLSGRGCVEHRLLPYTVEFLKTLTHALSAPLKSVTAACFEWERRNDTDENFFTLFLVWSFSEKQGSFLFSQQSGFFGYSFILLNLKLRTLLVSFILVMTFGLTVICKVLQPSRWNFTTTIVKLLFRRIFITER